VNKRSTSIPTSLPPIPTLSIIIVNWNTRELLVQCLQSIDETVQDIEVEVFVVDNDSTDDSVEMVRKQFSQVHLIENDENIGFARANNQAIRRASGRYILLLNSDAQLVRGTASKMVNFLETHPEAGIAGVCLAFQDGSPQFCYGSFPNLYTEFRSLFGMHRWDLSLWDKLDEPHEVDWISGACLMARREMLNEIGLLDEDFFMFGEEVDLCYRATKAGWAVVLVPSNPVFHIRAGSTGKSSARILRLYRGKIHYFYKHYNIIALLVLMGMIFLSSTGKLLFYSMASMLIPSLKAQCRLWWNVCRASLGGGMR
jgi:hypothetical protein